MPVENQIGYFSHPKKKTSLQKIEIYPTMLYFYITHNATFYNVHYENTPFQIYRKFKLQKLKIFR